VASRRQGSRTEPQLGATRAEKSKPLIAMAAQRKKDKSSPRRLLCGAPIRWATEGRPSERRRQSNSGSIYLARFHRNNGFAFRPLGDNRSPVRSPLFTPAPSRHSIWDRFHYPSSRYQAWQTLLLESASRVVCEQDARVTAVPTSRSRGYRSLVGIERSESPLRDASLTALTEGTRPTFSIL